MCSLTCKYNNIVDIINIVLTRVRDIDDHDIFAQEQQIKKIWKPKFDAFAALNCDEVK